MDLLHDSSTAAYCCLLTSDGELMYGIGDHASHQLISPAYVSLRHSNFTQSSNNDSTTVVVNHLREKNIVIALILSLE